MTKRIVGFGEAMLRLTVGVGESLETAAGFTSHVGGAELNGLIAAARTGATCTWVSALPDVPMAEVIVRHSRANGVAPVVARTTGRVGLYFLELAALPRPARILYDRAGSSFSLLDPVAIDWAEVLDADTWMYLTSITAAVGPGPRAAAEEAIATARALGAPVALDINYRSGLWSQEDAAAWVGSIVHDVDVLSASAEDLAMLGIEGDDPHRAALEAFGLTAVVGSSKRFHRDGTVSLRLVAGDASGMVHWEETTTVIDAIGAGDAMFGTFLGLFGSVDVAEAGRMALGAAVTSYGLDGDALVADPWTGHGRGGVLR